jgi:hypothetical protein
MYIRTKDRKIKDSRRIHTETHHHICSYTHVKRRPIACEMIKFKERIAEWFAMAMDNLKMEKDKIMEKMETDNSKKEVIRKTIGQCEDYLALARSSMSCVGMTKY